MDIQRIAVLLESHWPGLQVTEVDMAALNEAFRRNSVTYDEAVDAIFELVREGDRFQPRAPQILSKVKDIRRERARENSFSRTLERGTEQTMSAEEIRREVSAILEKMRGA